MLPTFMLCHGAKLNYRMEKFIKTLLEDLLLIRRMFGIRLSRNGIRMNSLLSH